jgi:uncharacterized protein
VSDSQSSPVFMSEDSDPDMQRAYEEARATFRYFWREIAWERRRIVPALDLAAVKAPFRDDAPAGGDAPEVEHMWLSDIDFDGELVTGVLMNTPGWVRSIQEGDTARIPIGGISDWMYAVDGVVYGAYTVNVLRSRMGAEERREHDEAWGLDFGDPLRVRVAEQEDHPMAESMAPSLRDHLAKNPSVVSATGHNGWTLLHQDASAGSAPTVRVLLEAGADPNAAADNGMTPLQLAQALGWRSVAELLARR